MRKKKLIYNAFWSGISYVFLFFLSLINRRLFLDHYDSILLGYQGVFANIFLILSITESGVGAVISYRLYKEIENKNENDIAKLMMVYKWIYRIIGIVIMMLGIFLLPFLNQIVGEVNNPQQMYTMYCIYLLGTVSGYFFSFRRLLFICNQKIYICVIVDTIINLIFGIIKILLILLSVNYVLYFSIDIFSNLISNIIISYLCNRSYPYAKYVKISFKDLTNFNIFKDIGFYSIQRISNAIYGGIDNIIISKTMGINFVVFLTNYSQIESSVTSFLDKTMSGLESAIGSSVYDRNVKDYEIFIIIDEIGYFLSIIVCISYCTLLQNFIYLWIGKHYLLDYWFVLFFSLNQYVAWNQRIIGYYRAVIGLFDKDIFFSILATIVNLLLSIILSQNFGFSGIIFATLISHVILWIGRAKIVYSYLFRNNKLFDYWKSQFLRFIEMCILLLIVYFITKSFPFNLFGLIYRCICCILIPSIFLYLHYRKSNSIKYLAALFNISSKKTIERIMRK